MYRDGLPDALDGIVLHGLERDPDRRFATAREFALALEQYGPLAPASEVGAWVQQTAGPALSERSTRIAEFESDPPALPETQIAALPDVQMRSDTYPVTRDRPTPPEIAGPGRSLGTSIIMDEVRRFAPWRRRVATLAFGVTITLSAVAVGLGLRGRFRPPGNLGVTATPRGAEVPAPLPVTARLECPSDMVAVPGGKLFMGNDDGSALERPAHHVAMAPFCIDRTEVTVEQYKACSDKADCKRAPVANEWEGLSSADARITDPLCNARDPERRKKHPINCIGWDMADTFCRASGKRLPTEAEWEYAARGSDGRKYPWGDDPPESTLLNACGKECPELGKYARTSLDPLYPGDDGWPTTAPVGSFPRGRSRFGAEDLAGNVGEWTAGYYAPYRSEPQADPKGPLAGRLRVVRGGAWNSASSATLRLTVRSREPAEKRSFAIGFRCAKAERR